MRVPANSHLYRAFQERRSTRLLPQRPRENSCLGAIGWTRLWAAVRLLCILRVHGDEILALFVERLRE